MDKKSLNINPNRHKLENLFDSMIESVSSSPEVAKEYLDEEDIDEDPLIKANIELIKKMQAQVRLAEGRKKQNWFAAKKKEFLERLAKTPDKIKADLNAMNLQVNFRNLDMDGLDDEQLKNLFEDASFLNYLETQSPDEDETKSK